jgi:hypothetical protein
MSELDPELPSLYPDYDIDPYDLTRDYRWFANIPTPGASQNGDYPAFLHGQDVVIGLKKQWGEENIAVHWVTYDHQRDTYGTTPGKFGVYILNMETL